MRPKINIIDKRFAVNLQDRTKKIDRQLAEIEEMLTRYARISPFSKKIRHIQTARKELSTVSAFARLIKNVAQCAEKPYE